MIRCGSLIRSRTRLARERPQLLHGTEADAIRLSQGTVDGSRFGNAHFGSTHERGNVGGICVSVTDKPLRRGTRVDCGLEYPTVCKRVRKAVLNDRLDSGAPPSLSYA